MTNTTFTTKSGMTYSISGTRYFKANPISNKKIRISKKEHEIAQGIYAVEQAEEASLITPAVLNEHGCVDCSKCKATKCVHRNCMRRNPIEIGGLAECPRLKIRAEVEEEIERKIDEQDIRTEEPKAKKVRRSKDVAFSCLYLDKEITLTAKQVDFIHHIPDTSFYENGLDSTPWCDVLADEIGGQFAGKPMTVGAMISTLREKGLIYVGTDRINNKKAKYFGFTPIGAAIAEQLGLN